MFIKGAKKYFTNPMIAMLPVIAYLILQTYFLSVPYALLISLFFALIAEIVLRRSFQSKIYSLPYYLMIVVFVVMLLLWLVAHDWVENDYAYIIAGEVIMIAQLIALRVGRTFIKANFIKDRSLLAKALLSDYFVTLLIFKYVLLVHIFFLLVYKELTGVHNLPLIDHLVYVTIPIFNILVLLVYQVFRTRHLMKKLNQEEWLPIVNQEGIVQGRIARSVSRNSRNKYMHPVVRVALISNRKLYLQKRDADYIVDPEKIDHPFEKYILFRHDVEDAVKNAVKMRLGHSLEARPEFVCKYIYETDLTKRLVFLFAIRVEDECQFVKTGKMQGKFWTIKQIDDDFGNQIFSDCFEMEYEYLKHVILLEDADCLIAATADSI